MMQDTEAPKTEIIPIDPTPARSVTLFGTDKPTDIVAAAGEVARVLRDVLVKQDLTVEIRGRRHVLVDGWTLAGTLLGVFPVPTWTRPIVQTIEGKEQFLGWEARVEARTRNGEVVGAAEAECRFSEARWAEADSYAVRSMAQTRATSKAMRLPLGFIISLAGYAATPFEEMPQDAPPPPQRKAPPSKKPLPPATDKDAQKKQWDDAWDEANPPSPEAAFALLCDELRKAQSKEDVDAIFHKAAKALPGDANKALRARLHRFAGTLAAERRRDESREPGANG